MLGKAALFEQVLQRLFAPAPARLGGIGERIAEPLRLALHLVLALAHFLDHAGKLAEGIDPLFLERLDLFLVALEPIADRGEQRLQLFLARLFGMAEPLLGALEKGLLRAVQNLCAGIFEFLEQIGARLLEQPLLFLESGTLGAELRVFLARGRQLLLQPVSPRGAFAQRRHLDPRLAQFGDGALELGLLLAGCAFRRRQPRAQIGERTRGGEPPRPCSDRKAEDERNYGENQRVHAKLIARNKLRTPEACRISPTYVADRAFRKNKVAYDAANNDQIALNPIIFQSRFGSVQSLTKAVRQRQQIAVQPMHQPVSSRRDMGSCSSSGRKPAESSAKRNVSQTRDRIMRTKN